MDIQEGYKSLPGKFDFIIVSQLMWYILLISKDNDLYDKKYSKKGGYILISQTFYKPGNKSMERDCSKLRI